MNRGKYISEKRREGVLVVVKTEKNFGSKLDSKLFSLIYYI